MTLWLDLALIAAVLNLVLLSGLGWVWLRNYRSHGAMHTLGLLVFAMLLIVQNGIWVYFYQFHSGYIAWFVNTGPDVQIGLTLLCGLETLALVFLVRITWQ